MTVTSPENMLKGKVLKLDIGNQVRYDLAELHQSLADTHEAWANQSDQVPIPTQLGWVELNSAKF